MGRRRSGWRALIGLVLCLSISPLPAGQAVQPVVFSALLSAQKAQEKSDFAAARHTLNAALQQAGDNGLELALVQQRLGYLAIAAGQHKQAIDWLSKALAQGQLDTQAARQDRLNLAQLLAADGQYAKAAGLLERERSQGGLSAAQTQLLVQCYSQTRNYSKAIPLAEQVVKTSPEAEDVWYQLLVGMHYQQGHYAGAVRWQQVLLQRHPQAVEHWRQLAGLQSQAGDQRGAAATLRLAHLAGLGLTSSDLENLVALQINAGAPWQAARLLEELISQQLLADSSGRQERLAQLWTQARDRNRARQAWASLAASSGRAEHWLRLAGLQLEEGDWPELLSTLQRARAGASNQQRQLIQQWEGYARSALEHNS